MTLNPGAHSGTSSLMCSRCLIYFRVRSRLGSPEVEALPRPFKRSKSSSVWMGGIDDRCLALQCWSRLEHLWDQDVNDYARFENGSVIAQRHFYQVTRKTPRFII